MPSPPPSPSLRPSTRPPRGRLGAALASATLASLGLASTATFAAFRPPRPLVARPGAAPALFRVGDRLASAAPIPSAAPAPPPPPIAPEAPAPRPEAGGAACVPHEAQGFLKRGAYVQGKILDVRAHRRALRWRVQRYGHVGTEETMEWNPEAAADRIVMTSFMGHGVPVHAGIVRVLRCVEAEIRRGCAGGQPYLPEIVHGHRERNTFRGAEVTNHLFGIALDVDPEQNPCCGCVAPWPDHPACKLEVGSPEERASIPRCWIDAFERFGFHWLGRDALVDTMHFEYLGDPRAFAERPARPAPSPERPGSTRPARSAKPPG